MTALAATAAARHDVLVAFGTLLFLAGAGLLIGCLLAATVAHYRRRTTPAAPVESVTPTRWDRPPAEQVFDVYTPEPSFDMDATAVFLRPYRGGRHAAR